MSSAFQEAVEKAKAIALKLAASNPGPQFVPSPLTGGPTHFNGAPMGTQYAYVPLPGSGAITGPPGSAPAPVRAQITHGQSGQIPGQYAQPHVQGGNVPGQQPHVQGGQGGGQGGRQERFAGGSDMHIPSRMAGLIIGKGGESLKNIERTCNVRISMAPFNGGDDEKTVSISGQESDIQRAKQMINDILTSNQDGFDSHSPANTPMMGHPGNLMGQMVPMGHSVMAMPTPYQMSQTRPAGNGPQQTVQVEIPANRIGLVIGKAGETIKNLQARSGAKIWAVKDADTPVNSPVRVVFVAGTEESIMIAKQLIDEVINPAGVAGMMMLGPVIPYEPAPAIGPMVTESILIAHDKVGLIIGKGGETLKGIKFQYSVQIVIEQQPNANNERNVTITGASSNVEAAKTSIFDKAFAGPRAKLEEFQNQHTYTYGFSPTYSPAPFIYYNLAGHAVKPRQILTPAMQQHLGATPFFIPQGSQYQ